MAASLQGKWQAGCLSLLGHERGAPCPLAVAETEAGASRAELVRQANQAFEDDLRLQGEGRFQEAAQQLQRLKELLNRMVAEDGKQNAGHH